MEEKEGGGVFLRRLEKFLEVLKRRRHSLDGLSKILSGSKLNGQQLRRPTQLSVEFESQGQNFSFKNLLLGNISFKGSILHPKKMFKRELDVNIFVDHCIRIPNLT